jgi:hypothetical protein
LLKLDRKYYSSTDDSFLREMVSKAMIAGKQIIAGPTLLLDVVRKFDLKAFWVPDRRRVMIDKSQPETKWRWNETHEIIHSDGEELLLFTLIAYVRRHDVLVAVPQSI